MAYPYAREGGKRKHAPAHKQASRRLRRWQQIQDRKTAQEVTRLIRHENRTATYKMRLQWRLRPENRKPVQRAKKAKRQQKIERGLKLLFKNIIIKKRSQ